jgi:MFS family permease
MTASQPATPVSQENRRARVAVALLFLTNGAVPANLIPLFPMIKSGLGLSNAEFGFAIAAGPIGALCSGLLAGLLIRRFRSARVAVVGMIISSGCALLAGIAPSWAFLAGSLFLLGALDAVVDVAQNSHGLRVQRRYGRSILNSFHAIWSIGAVLGALMGGAAAGLGIPVPVHLTTSAAIFTAVNVIGYRFLLPGPEPKEPAAPAERPGTTKSRVGSAVRWTTWATLIALGLIAVSGSIVEDAGASWAGCSSSGGSSATDWSTGSGSGRSPAPVGPSPRSAWVWRWHSPASPAPSSVSARPVSGSPPWFRPPCTRPTSCRVSARAPGCLS